MPLSETMNIAFGEVVNVKTIPSRGVTRIEIEVPNEFHVAATELLFGKPAFIFPVASKPAELPSGSCYGVLPFARAMEMTQPGGSQAKPAHPSVGMFGGTQRQTPFVALAGQVCREDTGFWRVLADKTGMPVTNETQATVALRVALGIQSRSELAENTVAQGRFQELMAEARSLPSLPA